MNMIQFTDKGFNLVYPDRKEKWEKAKDVEFVTGSTYVRFKGDLYVQKN